MVDVLYIHPYFHYDYRSIPYGLIGIMNSLNCSKIGKYYFEVKVEDIKSSKIIMMDAHWLYVIGFLEEYIKLLKKINPDVKIIIGGITANTYKDFLIKWGADFVVLGDSTIPTKSLVKSLLENRTKEYIKYNIPNIYSELGQSPITYYLNSDDFGKINYIDIDWFPRYQKFVRHFQKEREIEFDRQVFMFPHIFFYKGCIYDCENCDGSRSSCMRLYKRNIVKKKIKDLKKEFRILENKGYSTVSTFSDPFMVFSQKEIMKIFSKKYDFNFVGGDIYSLPDFSLIKYILGKVNKYHLCFIIRDDEFINGFYKRKIKYLNELSEYFKDEINSGKLKLWTFNNGRKFKREIDIFGIRFFGCMEWQIDKPKSYENNKELLIKYKNKFLKNSMTYLIYKSFDIKLKFREYEEILLNLRNFNTINDFYFNYISENKVKKRRAIIRFGLNGIILEDEFNSNKFKKFYLTYKDSKLKNEIIFKNNGVNRILFNRLFFKRYSDSPSFLSNPVFDSFQIVNK